MTNKHLKGHFSHGHYLNAVEHPQGASLSYREIEKSGCVPVVKRRKPNTAGRW